MEPRINTPGPGEYKLETQFEKASRKPKFNMGIKTELKANRAADMPGPGEYEIYGPFNQAGLAHVIGTG